MKGCRIWACIARHRARLFFGLLAIRNVAILVLRISGREDTEQLKAELSQLEVDGSPITCAAKYYPSADLMLRSLVPELRVCDSVNQYLPDGSFRELYNTAASVHKLLEAGCNLMQTFPQLSADAQTRELNQLFAQVYDIDTARTVATKMLYQLLPAHVSDVGTEAAPVIAAVYSCSSVFEVQSLLLEHLSRLSRQDMANWTIRCAERYLSILYDYLHQKLYDSHVLQADETPVLVNKDGRPAGSKSYMWVYRTGSMVPSKQIILYEYQDNRRKENPEKFLGAFHGYLQTDGYAGYNSVTKRQKDPAISVGCWAHARRLFCDALKAIPKGSSDTSHTNTDKAIAYADKIFAIERDNDLAEKTPQERMQIRQKKRFLFWMNISSGSEASIRITSSRESSETGSFTARIRRKHSVRSCLTAGSRAATMPQKGA